MHGDDNRKMFSKCRVGTPAEKIGSASAWALFIVGGGKQHRLPTLEGGWSPLSTDTWGSLCNPPPMPTQAENKTYAANQKFHRGAG